MIVAVLCALAFCKADVWAASSAPKAYVGVRVAEDCEEMGKVSGGNKPFAIGSKASLKATANKGYAFRGWWEAGEFVSASASYSYPVWGETTLEANFIPASDDWLHAESYSNEMWHGIGENVDECLFNIASGSASKITISGLPSGVTYSLDEFSDGVDVYCTGIAKKQGIYWVTCSVKNGNGYQSSATLKWVIGYPPETDYDHIGLGDAVDFLNDLKTGHQIYRDLSYPECDVCSGYSSSFYLKSVTGLPTGLKFYPSKCYSWDFCLSDEISGMPTKAGKYTITFTDQFRSKAVKTVVVRDSGSAYLKVKAGDGGYKGTGTASGSGVYVIGSKVKVSAKPDRNCYFAGWYCDESFDEPYYWMVSDSYQKASDSVDFSYHQYYIDWDEEGESTPPEAVYAKFVTKAEDAFPEIICEDEWLVDSSDGWSSSCSTCDCSGEVEGSSWFGIGVYSETLPKLTAKGVPAGIKFDADFHELYVSDSSKLKPGVYFVTISLKNQSGAKAEKVITVRIPNLRDEIFNGLEYEEAYVVNQYVSDACTWAWCDFTVESGWTVTASGLPAGLKFTFEKGLTGLCDGGQSTGRITGTPTKAGTYTVTFTAKGRDAWSGKTVTKTATVTFTVNPLPAYAVGKFNGVLTDSYHDDSCIGTFALTASSSGKLSATLTLKNGLKKSYSASSWNCSTDGEYTGYFYKQNKNGCTEYEYVMFTVGPDAGWTDCQLTGEFVVDACRIGGEGQIRAQRSPFGKVGKDYENWEAHKIAETLKSFGKMPAYVLKDPEDDNLYYLSCPNCSKEPWNPQTLNFTVGTDGAVKVSGKVDGMSISASSALMVLWNDDLEEFQPQADFCLYLKQKPIWIHVDFYTDYGPNGAVIGTMRYYW